MKGIAEVVEDNAEELRTYAGILGLYKQDLLRIETSISSLNGVRNAEDALQRLAALKANAANDIDACKTAMKEVYQRNFDILMKNKDKTPGIPRDVYDGSEIMSDFPGLYAAMTREPQKSEPRATVKITPVRRGAFFPDGYASAMDGVVMPTGQIPGYNNAYRTGVLTRV